MTQSKHRAAVVSAAGSVTGTIGEDIIVLPYLSPEYQIEFLQARAAVAEVGGALAHLAIVARETNRTVMVMPGACALLQPGMRVTLDPSRLVILVHGSSC